MSATVRRTRTDVMEGSGSGPTVEELMFFLSQSPGSGRVAVHHHDAEDARDSTSWRITVVSQPELDLPGADRPVAPGQAHTFTHFCGKCLGPCRAIRAGAIT